ncbi:MAG: DUF1800 domain-containing protein [Phycisphaerae bacterium]
MVSKPAFNRREFIGALGASAAGAAMLGGCSVFHAPPAPLPPPEMTPDLERRLLNRITFGPTAAEVHAVNTMGYDGFLEQQLDPAGIDDGDAEGRLFWLSTLNADIAGLAPRKANDIKAELVSATLTRAIYSKRQLFERMVEFWSDHFNIYHEKEVLAYLKTIDDREVIRRHALGNFRELLHASAKSPAMLVYLDNRSNVARAPNENYAREVMELHTVGLDAGYSQQDVEELARALTGWGVEEEGPRRGGFIFRPEQHDGGPKQIMGLSLLAGGGVGDGEQALDHLARHPSTARFIAGKLVRHFIADSAPQSVVNRVADAFTASDGDIRTTLRALFSKASMAEAEFKFKRPFHLTVGAARQSGADVRVEPGLLRPLQIMGHLPFQWATPDGYPDEADYWAAGLLNRWNLVALLPRGELPGMTVDARQLAEINGDSTPDGVVGLWDQMFFAGAMPEAERRAVFDYAAAQPDDPNRLYYESFALALASPSYQWH